MNCAIVFTVNADTRLSATEKVIFTNIAGGYQKRAEIAKASGCAESSVPRAVRKLESLGYLERKFDDGKPNTYVILTPPSAPDTGISQDTGITTSRTAKRRGIANDTGVSPPADTGSRGIEDAEFVDNAAAHIEHADARAQLTLNNYTTSELYPEPVELASAAAVAREAPAKVLNGSAKGLPTWKLAEVIVDHVNSPLLDPSKQGELHTTTGRIKVWMDAGADFDADILPAISEACAYFARNAGEPARKWNAFDTFVTSRTKKRLAAEAPMLPITPAEANSHDQRTRTSGRTYTGGKSNRHTDLLMRDIIEGDAFDRR